MSGNKNIIRVAVIGGGASGWSAVRALEESNQPDHIRFETTIFEKENRWGGKCCTVVPDGTLVNHSTGESSAAIPPDIDKRKYEMGAGVVSGTFDQPTENYQALLHYLKELDFSISLAERPDRQNYIFYKNRRETNPVSIGTILLNIRSFLRAKYDIWRNYTSNFMEYKDILKKYPLLCQHLTHRYSNQAVLEALAKVGAGFGYADQDDPHLSPPLLYFLDFIKAEQQSALLYSVDQGLETVWNYSAQKYSKSVRQRLNEGVAEINRDSRGITLKTDKNSAGEHFDKVVIATPLVQAQKIMDYTKQEQTFFNQVKYNHYVTVLCKVHVEKDGVGLVDIPNTVDRSKLGKLMFSYKPYADSNWMILYLYVAEGTSISDKEIVEQAARNLKEDMNAEMIDKKSAIVRHWEDYFAHLDRAGLESGWYEKFDKKFQNKNNTLYVGTPLHMESVGHSVRYAYHVTKNTAQSWIREWEDR